MDILQQILPVSRISILASQPFKTSLIVIQQALKAYVARGHGPGFVGSLSGESQLGAFFYKRLVMGFFCHILCMNLLGLRMSVGSSRRAKPDRNGEGHGRSVSGTLTARTSRCRGAWMRASK
jgi:hypothetical protein